MTDPCIEINDLSVAYPIYRSTRQLAKAIILPNQKQELFWALRGVRLSVDPGDRIGIVGPNGAGKSTLLRVIAGGLQPTSGSVRVHGRVSALWGQIAYWDNQETGRANAMANLALGGFTRKRAEVLLADIEDFVELGNFFDLQVKTYSSGMAARLMFAIATSVTPDILIVDEALGAGDGYFAAKAARRVREICDQGRALLFVSHSVAAVRQLCNKAVWLEEGSVRSSGDVEAVTRDYETDYKRSEDLEKRSGHQPVALTSRETMLSDQARQTGTARLRLNSSRSEGFRQEYLISSITVAFSSGARLHSGNYATTVQLAPDAPDDSSADSIDPFSCEWGRLQSVRGKLSRQLRRTYGRDPGGHFTIKKPRGAEPTDVTIVVTDISESTDDLILEYLEPRSLDWVLLSQATKVRLVDEPSKFEFQFRLPEGFFEGETLEIGNNPPSLRDTAAIKSISLLSRGEIVTSIREGQTFVVRVAFECNHVRNDLDVIITLFRSDGAYVFFQSTGMAEGGNLRNPNGRFTATFDFNPGPFGAGIYYFNVALGSGWRFPENYPHDRIYDRMIDGLRFTILPACSGLDHGVHFGTVPMEVQLEDDV